MCLFACLLHTLDDDVLVYSLPSDAIMAHLHDNSSSGSKAPSTTSTLRAIDALFREETCVSVFQYSPHTLTLQPRQRPASRPHLSRQVTAFVVASQRLAGAPPTPSHSGRRVCEVRTRHRRLSVTRSKKRKREMSMRLPRCCSYRPRSHRF